MINMNKPKLYIMVGLSASGKSTIAKQISEEQDCVIISSDAIRGEICPGGVVDQSKNEEVFKIFHRRVRENLLAGKNVIADATNLKIKSRRAILDQVKNIDCYKIAYIVPKRYEDCIKDDVNREYPVSEKVIKRQMYGFQIPFIEEGFDEIIIHDFEYKTDKNFMIDSFRIMEYFNQKNPHHSMTLGDHCYFTTGQLLRLKPELIWTVYPYAAKIHDVGKLYTQIFDENGIAHYYGHENVGVYLLLSHINDVKAHRDFYDDEILNILFLINYHMMPNNWENTKAQNKWRKIFGEYKYQLLLDFHKCDKARPGDNIQENNSSN